MLSLFSTRTHVLTATLTVIALAPAAHALERVSLRNGFSVDCTRHEALGERVRLYLGADDTNYQELPAVEIAAIEPLPDPPAPLQFVATVATVPVPPAKPTFAEMREMLTNSGAQHNIDVELLAAVVHAESNFHPEAVSRAGARGLMQLMPGTARDMGVKDAGRADQNIAGGTAYLDSLLKLYKDDLVKTLAAYNAGPAAVARYHGVPPFHETRAYVARVLTEFKRRKAELAANPANTLSASR